MANEQNIPPLAEVNRWVRHYRGEIATFNQTLGEMSGATASRTPRATAGSKPNTTRQASGATSQKRAAAGRKGGRARARKMGQGAAASGGTLT